MEGSVVKDPTSICREHRDLNTEDSAYPSGHQVAGGYFGVWRETNSACAYEKAMKLIVKWLKMYNDFIGTGILM